MAQPRPCPRPPRPRPLRGLRAASHRRRCQGSRVRVRVDPRPFVSLSGFWSCSPITPRAQPLQPLAPPQSTRISNLESILVGDGASPPRGRPRSVRTAAHGLIPPARRHSGRGAVVLPARAGEDLLAIPETPPRLSFPPAIDGMRIPVWVAGVCARPRAPPRARTLSPSPFKNSIVTSPHQGAQTPKVMK